MRHLVSFIFSSCTLWKTTSTENDLDGGRQHWRWGFVSSLARFFTDIRHHPDAWNIEASSQFSWYYLGWECSFECITIKYDKSTRSVGALNVKLWTYNMFSVLPDIKLFCQTPTKLWSNTKHCFVYIDMFLTLSRSETNLILWIWKCEKKQTMIRVIHPQNICLISKLGYLGQWQPILSCFKSGFVLHF